MEPVSDGLSADGLCVFVTPYRESQLLILLLLKLIAHAAEALITRCVCCLGGCASGRPPVGRAGGDELHLPPPAVIHVCCQVLRRPGQQEPRGSVCVLKLSSAGFRSTTERFRLVMVCFPLQEILLTSSFRGQ